MRPEILTMAKEALDMFAFLMTELIIFLVISYLVRVLQEFITPDKIQPVLSSSRENNMSLWRYLAR
jgi:hypothetical protein